MKAKSQTSLNEKDSLYDILENEKQLLSLYSTALFEGSSKQLRNAFLKHLEGVATDQFTIYSQMISHNYLIEPEPANKSLIDTALDNFKKVSKTLEG